MIILFAYKKGGTMKSTLATSLAAYLSEKKKVIIVDTDKDQYSSRNWVLDRDEEGYKPTITCITSASGEGLKDTLTALDKEYDYVIVDGHGGDTEANRAALVVCDAAIAPLAPTQDDLDPLKTWLRVFTGAQQINPKPIKLIAVLTQCTSQSRVNQAKTFFKNFHEYHLLKKTIKFRALWQSKPAGKGASEMKQKANAAMRDEFLAVAKELMKVIKK